MQQLSRHRNAADRARRVSELFDAIDSAKRLALRLGCGCGPSPQARELYERLEAARAELELIRSSEAEPGFPPEAGLVSVLGWPGDLCESRD